MHEQDVSLQDLFQYHDMEGFDCPLDVRIEPLPLFAGSPAAPP